MEEGRQYSPRQRNVSPYAHSLFNVRTRRSKTDGGLSFHQQTTGYIRRLSIRPWNGYRPHDRWPSVRDLWPITYLPHLQRSLLESQVLRNK